MTQPHNPSGNRSNRTQPRQIRDYHPYPPRSAPPVSSDEPSPKPSFAAAPVERAPVGATPVGPDEASGQARGDELTPPACGDDDEYVPRRQRTHRRRVRQEAAEYNVATHVHPSQRTARKHASRRQLNRGIETTELEPVDTETPPAQALRRPLWMRLRKLSLVLVAFLVLEGGLAVLSSPRFAISAVQFSGEQSVPPEVVAATRDSLVGQNWLRVKWTDAEQQLKDVPIVRSVRVTRMWTWPPQLAVDVQNRVAFARVGGGTDWWVVDGDGVPFRTATESDGHLYAVTGTEFKPQLGQAIDPRRWEPVVVFAGALSGEEKNGQRWNLRRVYFDRSGYASLRLTGGENDETLVQLGADDWPQKLQLARWALSDFARTGRHAASLNLISSNVVTWTPRAGANDATTGINTAGLPGITPEMHDG